MPFSRRMDEGNVVNTYKGTFYSVQLLSRVRLFATPWTVVRQASLAITNSQSLLKLISIISMMPANNLILCCPLLLPPSIFPSIRVFSNDSVLHIRWPKYWSFSFSICPSNEYSVLISFRLDWIGLLTVQGTLKSLLQNQFKSINSLALSFLYSPTLTSIHDYWKNHSSNQMDFLGKVISLLSNMLSKLVIAFLPRSKYLLISWLQSPSAVLLEPKKWSLSLFPLFPLYLPWSDGTGWHNLSFVNAEL